MSDKKDLVKGQQTINSFFTPKKAKPATSKPTKKFDQKYETGTAVKEVRIK